MQRGARALWEPHTLQLTASSFAWRGTHTRDTDRPGGQPLSLTLHTQQQGHVHLATLQQWPGYERTGRPDVATTRSVGGRVRGGGPLWALQGGGRAAEARAAAAAAAAAAAGGQRASSERDRTSISGGGAEANSRQGRARHDNDNHGEAGTTKGHGGLIRPRPRGAQDEYSAVTTRHARALCSRVLKTRTRVASTVG